MKESSVLRIECSMITRELLAAALCLSVVATDAFAGGKGSGLSWQRIEQPDGLTKHKLVFTDEVLIDEDFEDGQPVDWTVVDGGDENIGWSFGNADEAYSEGFDVGDHTEFAFCNSDVEGEGVEFDEWLITPVFDLSGAAVATLGVCRT